jgi:hypothetical protein
MKDDDVKIDAPHPFDVDCICIGGYRFKKRLDGSYYQIGGNVIDNYVHLMAQLLLQAA